jgi:hypothetical protein
MLGQKDLPVIRKHGAYPVSTFATFLPPLPKLLPNRVGETRSRVPICCGTAATALEQVPTIEGR